MNNKKLYRDLKDYMFNNYFEKLGFVRSGEISEKMEKRITGYSERFVKELGDGVFDVVDLFGYTDSGLFKLQIAYGLFVPEADSENFSKDEVKNICEECRKGKRGCVACKKQLIKNINKELEPIREKRRYFEERPNEVNDILMAGTNHAQKVAKETMKKVKEAMMLNYFE